MVFKYFYLGLISIFKLLFLILLCFFKGLIEVVLFIPKYFVKGVIFLFKRKWEKEHFNKIIFALSFSVYLICVFLISRWIFQNRKLTMLDKDIKDSTKIVEKIEEDKRNDADEELNNPIISSERSSFNLSNASFMSADLDELKEKNSDTVGWIKVLGTKIDYPFVQTTDNDYYLSHNFNKRFTNLGWVFGDYRNKWINFNRNTIIYAHNLNTGQFFGTLLDTLKESWFNNYDNHYVKLSTFDSDTIWQVVSVYTIKPESYYIRSIFSDYDFNEFLHAIKERSVFDFNYNYTLYDKILTLSTCDNGGKRRMVLHAKLVGILYK